jgi:aquaporin Z
VPNVQEELMERLYVYAAEVLGTFTLVFVGMLSILSANILQAPIQVAVAFGFGLALLAGLYAFGEISGGHYNPAVSLGLFLDRRLPASDLIAYWIAQFVGAVLAALAVLAAFDQDAVASTATMPGVASSAWDAFWIELLLTTIFVLVILQSTRSERIRGTALLAIPLTLVAAHLAAIPISGASLNPARTFGPALVGNTWDDIWIYFLAPPLGAVIAAAIDRYLRRGVAAEVEVIEVTTTS